MSYGVSIVSILEKIDWDCILLPDLTLPIHYELMMIASPAQHIPVPGDMFIPTWSTTHYCWPGQIFNSQKTPHISPLRVSYGVSIVSILVKSDQHCIISPDPITWSNHSHSLWALPVYDDSSLSSSHSCARRHAHYHMIYTTLLLTEGCHRHDGSPGNDQHGHNRTHHIISVV